MHGFDRRTWLKTSLAASLLGPPVKAFSQNADAETVDALQFASVTQLNALIEKREVSCQEILTATLQWQRQINPKLNAVVTHVDPEDLLALAKEADRRAAQRGRRGPLDGIPCTIKDNIETAGLRTTNGCPELASYRPKRDATLVRRLRDAGAIILGKTNVPEMCMDGDTSNVVFGRTKNPYDLERVPGGSSGGEAAIIAAGGSAFGIGTDIGGSIRQPSHCCGIAGIKSTSGRVPATGVLNSFHPTVWRWNGIGPMARSVQDLALVLKTIAGPDQRDPDSVSPPLQDYRNVRLDGLAILGIPTDGYSEPDNATARTFAQAIDTFRPATYKTEVQVLSRFHEGVDRWFFSQVPDWATAIREFRNKYASLGSASDVSKHHFQTEFLLRMIAEWEPDFDETRRMDEKLKVHEFREYMLTAAKSFDAIVTPVNNSPAQKPTTEAEYARLSREDFATFKSQGMFCHPFNLLGWPGVVVRCGTSPEGLPIGLQVVAKPWREDVALAVANFLESQLGGWRPPPRLITH